jgi:post-segregation antitoxin (ccd killing protein)
MRLSAHAEIRDAQMNFNVYLPDELGQRVKSEDLNLSRTVRDAVTAEFKRRDAMAEALGSTATYEFHWQDQDGDYTARITGKRVWPDYDYELLQIFVTADERVLAVYPDQMTYHRLDEPGQDFTENVLDVGLEGDELLEAFRALGLKPVIDL